MAELKSLGDLQKYNQELADRNPADDPVVQKLRVAKRITWMLLVAAAFMIFYLIDKMAEAIAILK